MEGLNSLFVSVLGNGVIDKEGCYGTMKSGLKGVLDATWTRGGSGNGIGGMCGDKGSG